MSTEADRARRYRAANADKVRASEEKRRRARGIKPRTKKIKPKWLVHIMLCPCGSYFTHPRKKTYCSRTCRPSAYKRVEQRKPYPTTPFEGRFWALVHKTDGCWLWTGQRGYSGYGRFRKRVGTPKMQAHRVAWEIVNGSPPKDMHLHHLCGIRHCVNPAHLLPLDETEHGHLHGGGG